MNFGEIVRIALLNTAIGMGTVFLILILISFCIWLLGVLCNSSPKPSGNGEEPADQAIASTEPVHESSPDEGIDTQLAAVIAAVAVRQFMKENDPEEEYIVRNVRRSKWKHTS